MPEMLLAAAEQDPQPLGVGMNAGLPSRVTWHITWDALTNGLQPSFDGVANYLKEKAYCPHLMWDPWSGRIVQFYPANLGGRALAACNEDGEFNIQIEVFFSPGAVRDGKTFATVADTPCNGLAEILAWTDSLGIPRVWPLGAPAWTGNSRDIDTWNSNAGHYGHCNVPGNDHTDPGPMPDLMAAGALPAGATETLREAEAMGKIIIARTENEPQVWRGDGLTRWPVWTMDTLRNLQFWARNGALDVMDGGAVQTVPDLNSIGVDQMAINGLDFYGKPLAKAK